MINVESDVRKVVMRAFGDHCFRVEAASGGTFGMPDTVLADPYDSGKTAFVELKVGTRDDKGCINYTVRPEQRKVIKRMMKANVSCWLLVGEVGTDTCWLISPHWSGALHGRAMLVNAIEVPLSNVRDKLSFHLF